MKVLHFYSLLANLKHPLICLQFSNRKKDEIWQTTVFLWAVLYSLLLST
jgi:hypothetical protein